MSTEIMAPRKNRRNKAGMAIAQAIIDEYQPRTAEDMQAALKDIFGPMFESMLQGEMDSHLGYEANDRGYKATDNRRNGYSHKMVKSTYGDIPVDVPRDRDASFEPQAIPKRSRDVSGIEGKVLSMYAKGMSQRDIADTIEEIYVCGTQGTLSAYNRIIQKMEQPSYTQLGYGEKPAFHG